MYFTQGRALLWLFLRQNLGSVTFREWKEISADFGIHCGLQIILFSDGC